MSASESHIQVPPDSSGKKLRALKRTVGESEVYEEVVSPLSQDGTVDLKALYDVIDELKRVLSPLVSKIGRLPVTDADLLRVYVDDYTAKNQPNMTVDTQEFLALQLNTRFEEARKRFTWV